MRNAHPPQVQSQLTIEGKLQTKISMLELKEKNMHQKHETLKHQLQADEKLINELKKQLDVGPLAFFPSPTSSPRTHSHPHTHAPTHARRQD